MCQNKVSSGSRCTALEHGAPAPAVEVHRDVELRPGVGVEKGDRRRLHRVGVAAIVAKPRQRAVVRVTSPVEVLHVRGEDEPGRVAHTARPLAATVHQPRGAHVQVDGAVEGADATEVAPLGDPGRLRLAAAPGEESVVPADLDRLHVEGGAVEPVAFGKSSGEVEEDRGRHRPAGELGPAFAARVADPHRDGVLRRDAHGPAVAQAVAGAGLPAEPSRARELPPVAPVVGAPHVDESLERQIGGAGADLHASVGRYGRSGEDRRPRDSGGSARGRSPVRWRRGSNRGRRGPRASPRHRRG